MDADLKDFFGSVVHEKLLTLVAQRVSDGRILRLIEAMLTAGSYGEGQLFPTERGTPQGGVASPLLSNILLTPFDREMRRRGYQLTRYADDWVITCASAAEARAALAAAGRVLKELGVTINPQKTRIVHVRQGFEFLGYKIKRGNRRMRLPPSKIKSGIRPGGLYAYPREKSIQPLQGPGPAAHAAQGSGEHSRADAAGQPGGAWLGPLLQAGPRPKALQPARSMDRAANLVASVQSVALSRLANTAERQALRRVRACELGRADSFLAASQTSVFVKAGCGKTARPV